MTSNAAHRELYRMGPAVVPELERRILESDWKTLEQPEAIRLLAGLVKLLHDIDEIRSREVIEQLNHNGCHPVAKRVLRSILRFSRENFRIYESHGIEIFESKEFEEGERVPHHLEKWLGNIPSEDLTGLKRITVIPFDLDAESTSHYVPAMAAITLVWMKFFRRTNPLSRLLRMTIESTLYHEVGHHVHRHEFGQIPDQERERRIATLKRSWASPIPISPNSASCSIEPFTGSDRSCVRLYGGRAKPDPVHFIPYAPA